MKSEILTICVPTWNRRHELEGLLTNIDGEIKRNPSIASRIRVFIADNASSDDTQDCVCRFQKDGGFEIRYIRHAENMGGIYNFKYVLSVPAPDYIIIMGDDDRFADGALAEIVSCLDLNEGIPIVILQSETARKYYNFEINHRQRTTSADAARHYFWYVGNASVFIVRSDLARSAMPGPSQQHGATCWPQTEILFRVAAISGEPAPFLLTGIVAQGGSNHARNTRASAYYIWETGFLGLLKTAQNMRADIGDIVYRKAVQSLIAPGMMVRHFFRMLLCLGSTDAAHEVADLRDAVRKSYKYAEYNTCIYMALAALVAWTPRWLARGLYPFISLLGKRKVEEPDPPEGQSRSYSAADLTG